MIQKLTREPQVTLLELAEMSCAVYDLTDESQLPLGWKLYGNGSDPEEEKLLGYRGQAFINDQTKEVVIAHRGTQNIKNVYLSDIPLTLGLHHNAEAAAIDYAQTVIGMLKSDPHFKNDADNDFMPIVTTTGHSLGGNEAQAVAAFFQNNSALPHLPAVTFQAPGVASRHATNDKSSSDYDGLNIVNEGDLVQFAGAINIGIQSWLPTKYAEEGENESLTFATRQALLPPPDFADDIANAISWNEHMFNESTDNLIGKSYQLLPTLGGAREAHGIMTTISALKQQPAIGALTPKQYRSFMQDDEHQSLEKLRSISPHKYQVIPHHRTHFSTATPSEIDGILQRATELHLLEPAQVKRRQEKRDHVVVLCDEVINRNFSFSHAAILQNEFYAMSDQRKDLNEMCETLQKRIREDLQLKDRLEARRVVAQDAEVAIIAKDIKLLNEQIARSELVIGAATREVIADAKLVASRQELLVDWIEERERALQNSMKRIIGNDKLSKQRRDALSKLNSLRDGIRNQQSDAIQEIVGSITLHETVRKNSKVQQDLLPTDVREIRSSEDKEWTQLDVSQEPLRFFEKLWHRNPNVGMDAIVLLQVEAIHDWHLTNEIHSVVDVEVKDKFDRYCSALSESNTDENSGENPDEQEKKPREGENEYRQHDQHRLSISAELVSKAHMQYEYTARIRATLEGMLADKERQLQCLSFVNLSGLDLLAEKEQIKRVLPSLIQHEQRLAVELLTQESLHSKRESESRTRETEIERLRLIRKSNFNASMSGEVTPSPLNVPQKNVGSNDISNEKSGTRLSTAQADGRKEIIRAGVKYTATYISRNADDTFTFKLNDGIDIKLTFNQTGAQPLVRKQMYDITLNPKDPYGQATIEKNTITRGPPDTQPPTDHSNVGNKTNRRR